MKYKLINAMAHNWTHSFMSLMNYVDDGYVCDDLYQLARKRPDAAVVITWVQPNDHEFIGFNPRIVKSVQMHRADLIKHFEKHKIDPASVAEMRTEVYLDSKHQIRVRSYVRDDRGKEHVQFVRV